MKEVLQNLALIDLMNFCKENEIDYSGSYVKKMGRGFKYGLFRNDGKFLVGVEFTKNSAPKHIYYNN